MKQSNISIVSHEKCTGCGACYNSCNVGAINMEYDIDGFLAPRVDTKKCTLCGICLSSCPIVNPVFDNNKNPECYAAIASNEEIRLKSSSGGIFSLLAEAILKKNGIVCGVAFNDEFLAEHIVIDNINDLEKLRGSKYLQSNTKHVYKEIKIELDKGRVCLFSGCPCQVGALNTYLGKKYINLYSIDLMCHGGPSPLLFKKYLKETYKDNKIIKFDFRDKSVFGWSTEANVYFSNGESIHTKRDQDDYYRAFLPCLSVRKSCDKCKFATLPRQGDITLADFWGVHKYNKTFTDGKGTSIVIINSDNGKNLYKLIKHDLKLNEQVPLDYIKSTGQPLEKSFKNHPERDRYFEIVRHNSVKKAYHYIRNRKFDVGIIGVWPGLNFGSVLTYFALQAKIKDIGLSPLMIDKPGSQSNDPEVVDTHSRRFAKEHFHISQRYALKDLHALNRFCDSFLIGSDQVWNYGISKHFGKSFYLNFANDDKKKIAYASSFGHSVDFAPVAERIAISKLMQRFDAISVREDTGVTICNDLYNVKAVRVLDPVFLIDVNIYKELAEHSTRKIDSPYVLAYILDVTPEKKELMLQIAKQLNLKLIIILDGFEDSFKKNKQLLNLDKNVQKELSVYDWLRYFRDASYVLTDSFHGTSFSILFGKQFITIPNKRRGYTRFASITKLFSLEERLVGQPCDAIQNKLYLKDINYQYVNKIITSEKTRCIEWLKNAFFSPKIYQSMTSYPIIDTKLLGNIKSI